MRSIGFKRDRHGNPGLRIFRLRVAVTWLPEGVVASVGVTLHRQWLAVDVLFFSAGVYWGRGVWDHIDNPPTAHAPPPSITEYTR